MTSEQRRTEYFERSRRRLKSIAYRLLGNRADAEDALQDAWIRIAQSEHADSSQIDNLDGWLTTVVVHVCLNKLRERRSHPSTMSNFASTPLDLVLLEDHFPGPEEELQLAQRIGIALQIVLETLSPPERTAYVLHDLFDIPFEEIAEMLRRTPEATRKLASRGRHRIRAAAQSSPQRDIASNFHIMSEFFAASRTGDTQKLTQLLHPEVALEADGGDERPAATAVIRGRSEVLQRAMKFAIPNVSLRPAILNGLPAVVVQTDAGPVAVMSFIIRDGQIAQIYSLLGIARLRGLIDAEGHRANSD